MAGRKGDTPVPRDERMFGDVVDPSIKMGNRQGRSVLFTILLEAVLWLR